MFTLSCMDRSFSPFHSLPIISSTLLYCALVYKKKRKKEKVRKIPLMSRNAQSNLKVRIDKISSNQVNVDGFDAFGEFSQIRQSEISLADLTILTSFRHFRFCIQDISRKRYKEKKNNWQRSCTPFGYRSEGGNGPLYIYIEIR